MTIDIKERAGDFAEDKDIAAEIRETILRSAVRDRTRVTLDFTGVSLVTQSFVHALIADVLRTSGEDGLRLLVFKGCAPSIKGIISTVVQYSLESIGEGEEPPAKPPNQELEPAGARTAERRKRRPSPARPRRKN